MKSEYGIPVPRGVRRDWEATSMGLEGAGDYLCRHYAPSEWGRPTKCVAWADRFGRIRLCIGHYANGRSATVRIDANGKWKTHFGFARAIEARRAETPKSDSVEDESAVPKGCAQSQSEPPQYDTQIEEPQG